MNKAELVAAIFALSGATPVADLEKQTNADLEQILKALEAEDEADADAEAEADADAEAKQPKTLTVKKGTSLTSKGGLLLAGEEVTADMLAGGQETLDSLKKRGLVV